MLDIISLILTFKKCPIWNSALDIELHKTYVVCMWHDGIPVAWGIWQPSRQLLPLWTCLSSCRSFQHSCEHQCHLQKHCKEYKKGNRKKNQLQIETCISLSLLLSPFSLQLPMYFNTFLLLCFHKEKNATWDWNQNKSFWELVSKVKSWKGGQSRQAELMPDD